MREANISELVGQVLLSVENRNNEELIFRTADGKIYELYHVQDCCEGVWIEDIAGDLNDLVGSPILIAEERTNSADPPPVGETPDSYTWTFYTLATRKGHVDIRFYGTSNGYYSESVDFVEVEEQVSVLGRGALSARTICSTVATTSFYIGEPLSPEALQRYYKQNLECYQRRVDELTGLLENASEADQKPSRRIIEELPR